MAKKDEPIAQPGPVQTQQRDLGPLKALIQKYGPPTFEGAKRGYGVAPGDRQAIFLTAQEYQTQNNDVPSRLIETLAYAAYWELFDEQAAD